MPTPSIPNSRPTKRLAAHQQGNPKKRLRHATDFKGGTAQPQHNRSGGNAKNGSYKHYYDRRHGSIDASKDDRLPVIHGACKRFTSSFSLLDVGCNDGALTMQFAQMQNCSAAVGVDIDSALILKARDALRQQAFRAKRLERGQGDAPISCRVVQGRLPSKPPRTIASSESATNTSSIENPSFPFNLTFRCEDFASEEPTRTAGEVSQYDVILCLSVTKWVHLAGGDEALKRFFARVKKCLKPGGMMILEPQLNRSYKLARQKGLADKSMTFERLKLRPDLFKDYLLKEAGFSNMDMLRDKKSEKGRSFNRPIMAFYVPERQQNQESAADTSFKEKENRSNEVDVLHVVTESEDISTSVGGDEDSKRDEHEGSDGCGSLSAKINPVS